MGSLAVMYQFLFIQHTFTEYLSCARHYCEWWGNTHEQSRQKLIFASRFAGYKAHSYIYSWYFSFFLIPYYQSLRLSLILVCIRETRPHPCLCFPHPVEHLLLQLLLLILTDFFFSCTMEISIRVDELYIYGHHILRFTNQSNLFLQKVYYFLFVNYLHQKSYSGVKFKSQFTHTHTMNNLH